jgi:hypothetical protein
MPHFLDGIMFSKFINVLFVVTSSVLSMPSFFFLQLEVEEVELRTKKREEKLCLILWKNINRPSGTQAGNSSAFSQLLAC